MRKPVRNPENGISVQKGETVSSSTQRTPPYQKYYAVVNLLGVVNSLSHIVIYYRGAPCADAIFLGIADICPLKEGFTA